MLVFKNGIDIRTRQVIPQIAEFWVTDTDKRYCVIGTEYGHIHTSGGDVRVWKSKSGAYSFLRQYVATGGF